MQTGYLLCKECNGYYKLQNDEDPNSFGSCSCGGDLLWVDDIEDYFQYYYEYSSKSSKFRNAFIVTFSCLLIGFILIMNIYYPPLSLSDTYEISNKFILGSDNRGYVTKEVYGNSLDTKEIAVVTGIHPREKLSKRVTTDVIKNYQLSNDLKIIHYDITVTSSPENYYAGRSNGEGLAADYILSDIKKSDYNVVIICHDHKPGYGSGFYIATPQMDEKSVKLASLVNRTMKDFKYYRADNAREHSSSALKFSKPLASYGLKTLVYEMSGLESYNNAYNSTYRFIDTCSLFLT